MPLDDDDMSLEEEISPKKKKRAKKEKKDKKAKKNKKADSDGADSGASEGAKQKRFKLPFKLKPKRKKKQAKTEEPEQPPEPPVIVPKKKAYSIIAMFAAFAITTTTIGFNLGVKFIDSVISAAEEDNVDAAEEVVPRPPASYKSFDEHIALRSALTGNSQQSEPSSVNIVFTDPNAETNSEPEAAVDDTENMPPAESTAAMQNAAVR